MSHDPCSMAQGRRAVQPCPPDAAYDRPMSSRPTLVLAALTTLLATGLAGCGSTTCTLIGCDSQMRFDFDRTVPRDYTVTVTVAGRVGRADCTAAAAADTSQPHTIALEGDLTDLVECGTDSFTFFGTPDRIAITLEYADGTRTDAEAQPVYEEQFPNGEDCGAVCQTASAEIAVHAPAGA